MYNMKIELPLEFTVKDLHGVVNWLDDNIGLGSKKLFNSEFDENIHVWKGLKLSKDSNSSFMHVGFVHKADVVATKLKYGAQIT